MEDDKGKLWQKTTICEESIQPQVWTCYTRPSLSFIHCDLQLTGRACSKSLVFLKEYISLSLLIKIRTVLNSYTSFKIYKYTVLRKSSANLPWYGWKG